MDDIKLFAKKLKRKQHGLMKEPVSIRSLKLSSVDLIQYLDEWPLSFSNVSPVCQSEQILFNNYI